MKNGSMQRNFNNFFKYINGKFASKPTAISREDFVNVQGTSIPNHFSWIKVANKKTLKYIEDENRFSDKYFTGNKREIKKIKIFFESLYPNFTDELQSKTEKYGNYVYSYESVLGEPFPTLFRSNSNNKQVVIDQSANTGFLSVGQLRICPNEQLVAVALDFKGVGKYDCCVIKPAETSRHVECLGQLENVSSYEWASNDVLIYTELDVATLRSSKLYKYTIHTGRKHLVYTEDDPRYSMEIYKSRSREKLMLNVSSKLNSEVWLCDHDGQPYQLLCSRNEKVDSSIDHMNDCFYNLTEDRDNEYCIKYMRDEDASHTWTDFISRANKMEFIFDMVLLQDQLIVLKTKNMIPTLSIYPDYCKEKCVELQVSNAPGCLEVVDNENADLVNVTFTSPIQPITNFEIETKTNSKKECRTILPSWKTEDFEYRNIEPNTKDGAKVPVSLFYKKDIELASAPMLCRVYGSYGAPVNLQFNHLNAYLLTKGWILMYSHVRGGQELGRNWYLSSRLHHKHNTFHDLQHSLEGIHNRNISSPQQTALYGKSAGGLPIAWLLNNAPELCSAAVMEVPFISVLHTMLNENEQLTSQEYMEWGNPRENTADLKYISSYCPYHNMKVTEDDPAVLVHMSMYDDIVPYWIPLQWIAKRRDLLNNNTNGYFSKPLLCRVNLQGGHHGYDNENKFQKDAEIVTFLMDNITA